MISKITLNKVARYKKTTILETDKKVNLIYGLNGSGKSTLSNFLSNQDNPRFSNCIIEGLTIDNEVHVLQVNHKWIYVSYFNPSDNLPQTGWIMKKYLDKPKK